MEKQCVKEKTVEKRHLGYEMEMMAHQDMEDDVDMIPVGWQVLACVSKVDYEEVAGRVCNNVTGEDCRVGAVRHQGECV